MNPHISVLLAPFIEFFKELSLTTFIDCTLGAGGHSEAILKSHPELKLLIGIDQDPEALRIAKNRLSEWKEKTVFMQGNFLDIDQYLKDLHVRQVEGILFDLGVSSMQFDQAERGFSFMRNGPLDMRMDTTSSLTAEEIVNTWPEQDLARIFRDYGEERHWRAVARTIVQSRAKAKISTTHDLVHILEPILGSYSKKGIHPMTLVFQGLRICVNRELEVLKKALPKAIRLLSPGGRLAVMSFHSLEDREVKHIFRSEASKTGENIWIDKESTVQVLTKKPVIPTEEEIKSNVRCRSAKLRVVEKK